MVLGGVLWHRLDLGDHTRIWGVLIGIVIMATPFYLAWRGLGSNSTLTLIRSARLANMIAGLVFLVSIGLISLVVSSVNKSLIAVFYVTFFMLIGGIPYALNINALARRKVELEEKKLQ